MPAPYGITDSGFSLKTFDEIKLEKEALLQDIFGPIDISAESQFGQLIATLSQSEAELWQVLEALWNANDPNGATGIPLDNMSALVNITRKPETYTQVVVRFSGTNGSIVPSGALVSIDSGETFATLSGGTVSGGFVDLTAEAVNPGPVKAFANTVTVLNTPIAGISSVNNPADATVQGQSEESDERLRSRRRLMFNALGLRSAIAMKTALLEVENVTDAYVFENNTDTTNEFDMPPHSIECVVTGGDDTEIAEEIYRLKASGVQTSGNTTESVTDSEGNALDINFSRPEEVEIYLTVVLRYDPAVYAPTTSDVLVKSALLEFVADDINQGSEVRASRFIPSVFSVPGVLEVDMPKIGLSASPTLSDTLVFDVREIPVFDTTRIVITSSAI